MKLSTLVQYVNFLAAASAAAIVPHKRATLCGQSSDILTVTEVSTWHHISMLTTTVVQTTTIQDQPDSVAIALQDPQAITSSLSSAFSVESEQLEIASQIAPIIPLTSGRPPTSTSATIFTRTIQVPVVEATNDATDVDHNSTANVYFIDSSNGTTSWLTNYTPAESRTIGTTTVTLSPIASVPPMPEGSTTFITRTTRTNTITAAARQPEITLSPSIAEKGNLRCRSKLVSDGSIPEAEMAVNCNVTQEMDGSIHSDSKPILSDLEMAIPAAADSATESIGALVSEDGYMANMAFSANENSHIHKRSGESFRERTVCEWVTATMRGVPASWRNNWDGSTTVDCAAVSPTASASQPANLITITVALEPSQEPDVELNLAAGQAATSTVSSSPTETSSTSLVDSTSCGVSGQFTLDFDTLPAFSPPDNDTAPFPPIFNPYRHLFFSSGWAYVPPPTVPVSPQEGNHLAVYVPTAPETDNAVSQSMSAGIVPDGAFGAGPRAPEDAYWFDAGTLYVFCDHGAGDRPEPCDVIATGYQWQEAISAEEAIVVQHFPQKVCSNYPDCQTSEIMLSDGFRNLSSLRIEGVVNGNQTKVYMDTVHLTWSNGSCNAGLLRASDT